MKKFISYKLNQKGFTLIELLVTITILGILAIIGSAVYSNVTDNAREGRKKSDVQAIAKVMELNYNASSNSYPNPVQSTMFAKGVIPQPPDGGNYSILYSSDNSSYRVCAALKGDPGIGNGGGCTAKSPTCFCLDASRGSQTSGSGIPGSGGSNPLQTATLRLQPSTTSISVNTQFTVQLLTRTDAEAANTFAAFLQYDPTRLEVTSSSNTGSFITSWIEQLPSSFPSNSGEISMVGGYPAPGYQTSGAEALMATITFRAISSGNTSINFEPNSEILRNGGDNEDILISPTNLQLTITP